MFPTTGKASIPFLWNGWLCYGRFPIPIIRIFVTIHQSCGRHNLLLWLNRIFRQEHSFSPTCPKVPLFYPWKSIDKKNQTAIFQYWVCQSSTKETSGTLDVCFFLDDLHSPSSLLQRHRFLGAESSIQIMLWVVVLYKFWVSLPLFFILSVLEGLSSHFFKLQFRSIVLFSRSEIQATASSSLNQSIVDSVEMDLRKEET